MKYVGIIAVLGFVMTAADAAMDWPHFGIRMSLGWLFVAAWLVGLIVLCVPKPLPIPPQSEAA